MKGIIKGLLEAGEYELAIKMLLRINKEKIQWDSGGKITLGAFKILNDDKLKDKVFIGFVKGDTIELFTYGGIRRLKTDEVELVQIK